MDRGESYELLIQVMNELRNQVASSAAAQVHAVISRDIQGRSGRLYAIEAEAVSQSDGRILIRGWASEHNPHEFQRIEESFLL